MVALRVVVLGVLGDHGAQMFLAEDDEVVEAVIHALGLVRNVARGRCSCRATLLPSQGGAIRVSIGNVPRVPPGM